MSDVVQRLKAAMLSLVPADGTPVGNTALRREAEALLQTEGMSASEADYWLAHADLIADGRLRLGPLCIKYATIGWVAFHFLADTVHRRDRFDRELARGRFGR